MSSPLRDEDRTSQPVHPATVPFTFGGLVLGFLLGYIIGPWGAVIGGLVALGGVMLAASKPGVRNPVLMGLGGMVIGYTGIMLVALLNM
ncbi:hypothetical protein M3A96_02010 [Helcobacillus massiliensis]|uniref:Uncharacterized protein n=1 Tax=Helcobacillus massiliensis TaxID=521392 RepID=A0A839QW89_9MICO|nr:MULTISPECIES: hypothetical protein [Helcobacillus]MBB3022261.1 hypothetical protein [Helcobacillus massiliensis]MCG7426518.1 hypothetical protein [Helcobacillus sp. ACRRO]MCT1556901.1 hypothetical protein [Helcobacillus massiliensis]MCT2035290.1 hypothetical protein [Helcobacillus massiliensis]MCT2331495.1 hypothetical protein [Helcobacillus massiliensis]